MTNGVKTHCVHGHALSGPNLHIRPDGSRRCRTCHREQKRRYASATYIPLKERPLDCGHPASERTRKNTCRVCSAEHKREYNRRYLKTYTRPQTERQRRAAARAEATHLFWRGKHLGRVIDLQGERIVYRSIHGYESRVPKVEDWVRLVPEAHIADLLPLYG